LEKLEDVNNPKKSHSFSIFSNNTSKSADKGKIEKQYIKSIIYFLYREV